MKRIFGLDILRAFAIFGVLFFHALPFMNTSSIFKLVASRGWAGVDLFFVLSGFLVGSQLSGIDNSISKREQCFTFWLKRWTRTIPLYLIVLIFYVIVKPNLLHAPFAGGFNWKWLFFLQNLSPIRDFGQTWSLAIEEQFYLIFPFFALILSRRTAIVWLLPMVFSVVFRGFLSNRLAIDGSLLLTPQEYVWAFRFPTWAMLDSISMGVFLAKTYSTWSQWSLSIKKVLGIIGLITITLTLLLIPENPTSPIGVMALYSLLATGFGCILIYFETIKTKIAVIAFLEPVALWSYSTYLLHDIIVRFITRYFLEWNHWLLLSLYICIVLAISKMTYEYIEIPGMKLRKLFLRQR